jgi:V8-like Glu-specific endopeptidase
LRSRDTWGSSSQVESWTDDRVDVYELSGENLEDADSVVALIDRQYISDEGNGTSTLLTVKYGEVHNLCPSERFQHQPSTSACSGVLVAPDIIATAAHCVTGKNLTDIRVVFGYRMNDAATAQTVFTNSEIYQGVEVIGWELDETTGADWTLIRLDRPVVNHRVAHLRESGTIIDGAAVHVIGHPMGLPAKFASGFVRHKREQAFFNADFLINSGSSGSPVFNSTTHEVEGILVRGRENEFVKQGDCWVTRAKGGASTRTSEFLRFIPWLQ